MKRARAVVHTTALRNRASGLPVATTLSVSSPGDLTISAVRAKLRLSPVPALNTPLPQTPPDLTGLPGALPAGLPPLPPKDVPPSPRQVATPGSSHSGTSNYFATDALDNGPLSSTSDKHHVEHAPKSLSLTGEVAPLKSRKRTPSPINIPTTNIPDTQRTRSATSQVENEVHSPSFMSYLQHGTAPSSPVNSKHSTQASQHQPPSPLQQSSVVSDQLNTGAPSPQAHSIIESYSQRDAIEEQPIQPPDLVHPGQRGGIQRSASDEIKEQYQRQSSVTVTESPTSRPKDQRTSQSSHSSLSPPVRSSSLDHSLSATASTHFSSKTHEEAPRIETLSGPSRSRGLSNASSANASPVVDNYSESISTSITSATGDSSSSALASSHKKSRDAALTAELQRQDAWEADEPRRKLLPMAEQVALERNELERRAAAERQRREIRWHNAMAQQEVMAAEDAERQAQEQVEREAQELKLQKEREARAEQVRIEAEQKKQEAARQKAAKQEELRQRLQQLSADTKEVMLDGFVSVQNPNSTLWRRRWFQLRKGRLSLFKSPEVSCFRHIRQLA